jgi:hypothetical protein
MRKAARRIHLVICAFMAALAVAPPAAAQNADPFRAALAAPCALITLAEVQALIGNPPMLPATPTINPDLQTSSCQYANDYPLTADPKTKHTIEVSLYGSAASILRDPIKDPPYGGLGIEAYCDPRFDGTADQGFLLVAIDGGHTLEVAEQGGWLTCDQVAQFAQIALGRLNSGSLVASPTPPPVSADLLTNAMAYPCSIVTADEASAIFGGTMETSLPPIGQPKNPFCTWHNGMVSIIGQIYSEPEEIGENDIGAFQTLTGPGGVEADCSTPGPGQMILITAIDANHYLSVVEAVPGGATCDQALQFALKALPRL